MSVEQIVAILWRRKWIVVTTVVVATAATYFVSRELPAVYSAQATLFVADRGDASNDFEALQSGQVLARTYAELIQSRNVAEQVTEELPDVATVDEVLGRTSFRPVPDTQLIVISAEGPSLESARELADTYAEVFADYADFRLEGETGGEVAVADAAQGAPSPVRPRPRLYAAVMFVLALFIGAGIALLRERLATRLGREEELSRDLELPLLARVPTMGRRLRWRPGRPFVDSHFLEAFRILRTNLSFLVPGEHLKSIAVASGHAGEGKSTCAIGLAQAFGEVNRRVVIVEGDMRRPSLAKALKLPEGAPGLFQYLAHDYEFSRVVHGTSVPGVHVVPAGSITSNPSSLLREDAIAKLLRDAAGWADVVVIDSPPLSAGAESAILANAAEGVALVINHRRSSRDHALSALAQLRQTEARVVGYVLNEVPEPSAYYRYDTGSRRGAGAAREPSLAGSRPAD